MNNNPYISFVVTARNDDYGGDFLARIQNFCFVLHHFVKKTGLRAELIIVEWNPPLEKPRLKEALDLKEWGDVRFIEVPSEIHASLPNSEKMPIYEYIGKNVGVRRAKGEYILVTNPDLIFSESLVRFLARQSLSPKAFYRADRFDFAGQPPAGASAEEKISFAKKRVYKIETLGSTLPIDTESPLPFWLKCFLGYAKYRFHRLLNKDARIEARLHTNAAGDFFLMSRNNWHKLRAYPELPSHSLMDAYMCCLAASSGQRQVILGEHVQIFHQEHDRPVSSRPVSSYEEWRHKCEHMLKNQKAEIENRDDWGLGSYELSEESSKHA